ncbi:dihydrofolate reductase [Paenibacillus sp. J5C_2022]|uniref:dihydrofolate reductase n=1 Tax=Paenibacillus sp. J5C2022 TaxID=2977129 RepID=UPI0021CFD2B9|nr:dihydrofolate reductase [Paenibacillus sp. J5C2022]MCU6708175.1 dihydrofolate reductase [Paenibacillus sp. J5C2022]
MTVVLIAAMDRNRVIGQGNAMPWHLPAEMAYFRRMTTGKTVLMGRKTFESLGSKPLPNRRNVVLTRQQGSTFNGCEVVHSVQEALSLGESDELMVIGGGEVYELLLPYAEKVLLTHVEADIERGDASFPELPSGQWIIADSEYRAADEKNAYAFTFVTYKRINAGN